ncbi:MAG: sialate O-acetylesterase [Lentimicrobium sp.]
MNKRTIFIFSIILIIAFLSYGSRIAFEKYTQGKINSVVIQSRQCLFVDKGILYSRNTALILTFGQSNAACYGQGTYICRNDVYEYYKGEVYKAAEPLLGADGNNGCSVWTRFSDMLIDSGLYNKVILLPIGIGSTSIHCWSDGDCNKKLRETLQYIERDSIKITHVILHQGESDNLENTPKDAYKASLKKILLQLREHGIKADFYVCVASFHPNVTDKFNGVDTCIQRAQIEFAEENVGTKPGPDTDLINSAEDRWDGVHFSKTGLDKFARELYRKITE